MAAILSRPQCVKKDAVDINLYHSTSVMQASKQERKRWVNSRDAKII